MQVKLIYTKEDVVKMFTDNLKKNNQNTVTINSNNVSISATDENGIIHNLSSLEITVDN